MHKGGEQKLLEYYITICSVLFTSYIAQTYQNTYKAKSNLKTKKQYAYGYIVFAFITAAILIFVGGFRFRVGADYGNYTMAYYVRKDQWVEHLLTFDEPGLAVICKLASMIYDDYATMFFICSLITIGMYLITITKYCDETFIISILLFIFTGSWAGSFGAIRQYLAAAVIFIGHRLILERKFFKYALLILAAMFFHRTAIIMLPVYFIATRKINVRTILILILVVVAIIYSYDSIFDVMSVLKDEDQAQYEYMQTQVNAFRVLVAFAPIGLYFITSRRRRPHNDKEVNFYSMLLFINAAFLLSTSNSAYLARVAIFTEAFPVIAFPKLLKYEPKATKNLYMAIILVCYFAYFSYQIYCSDALNNFRWIWERTSLFWW